MDNPKEIERVMTEFQETKGWKIIQEQIDPIIKTLELKLLGDDELTPEEQSNMKRDWKLYKKFYEYPQFIIDKCKMGDIGENNTDPYEQ